MARLQFKAGGYGERELRAGTNRLGRAEHNDLSIDHLSVSGTHCEVVLGCGQITVRDCNSTNGTFVDGRPVKEAPLREGQTLRLGEVELLVTDADIPVSIPKFEAPIVVSPPVMLPGGALSCRQHPGAEVVWRCNNCSELLCDQCIHRLRRRGGKLLCLCPRCSFPVQRVAVEKKKKKTLVQRLRETTRLLFGKGSGN
ncbi:MAG TPA: FHA domain-containing protein [Verrucomicrobiae bacterium]|nr:FHA domain-containing protein [Verrucomicrobiae bacterium]